jgi:O-antigen/teichoic acid export membrane protein
MNSLRKKVGIQFLASNGALAANFVLSIVIARLLSPQEIGIFSMSAVLVAFSHVFRDFGVFSYIKRQPTLDPQTIRTATGILYVTSVVMAALLYASSWWWGRFFRVDGVREVVQILSIGFLFIPFGAIPAAVLSRSMEVEKAAKVTIFATAVYVCASISFALLGFSYTTMAWANLVNILAVGIGFHFVRPAGLPRRPSLQGWRKIIGFGSGTVLTSSLKALDNALPDVMLGRMGTPAHVGYFSRANSTVGIINSVLTPTINALALPYLAKTYHSNARLDIEFCRGTSYLTSLIWPALGFMLVMKNEVILTLYGSAWTGAVPAIAWLCGVVAIQTAFSLMPHALMGMGKPYATALPLGFALAFKFALALALFDGSLQSFAEAVLLGELLAIPLYVIVLKAQLGIGVRKWLHVQARPAALTVTVCAAVWAWRYIVDDRLPTWASLGVAVFVATVVWLLGAKLLRLPLWSEISVFLRRFKNE